MSAHETLGRLVKGRARPTYVVVANESLRSEGAYPKENFLEMEGGGAMRWVAEPWSMVAGDRATGRVLLKIRNLYAGIFKEGKMICFFRVTQTKNTCGSAMRLQDLMGIGQAVGFEAAMHAKAGAHAIVSRDGIRGLRKGEVITELAELFIPYEERGVMAWVEGLMELMKVAGEGEDVTVCILNASPLELSACIAELEDAKLGASRAEVLGLDKRLRELDVSGARRTRAMQRLYRNTLGFKEIDSMWMWRSIPA